MCAVAANALFSPGDAFGKYVIEACLGTGGCGAVFLARERSLGRQVALKFVRPELAADVVFSERFEREATAMAAVEHPNVVPIYAHDREQGLQYLAMRYVPGGSLAAFLEGRQRSLEDVVELLAGVAEGLDCCHARGVVHRDLKPANVLVDVALGHGLLTDFGIALTDELATLTGPGHAVGTPGYMAPEVIEGSRATPASDRWALAAIAYRAATGRLPRGLGQPSDTAPIPPSRRNDRLGPDVDRVLLRALSIDPTRRHPDARTFVADLRDALEGPTHRATRRTIRPEALRGNGTRRWWSVAGAALLLTPMVVYGVASVAGGEKCHPSYADACLKPDSEEYDCAGGGGDGPDYIRGPVRVVGEDVYRLDGDRDGIAC